VIVEKQKKNLKETKTSFLKLPLLLFKKAKRMSSTNPSGSSTPNTGWASRSGTDSIDVVKQENIELKKQIEMLMQRVSLLELKMSQGSPDTVSIASPPAASTQSRNHQVGRSSSGRKSIPYELRNAKQHQNRMEYLLKKMKQSENWQYDTIVDVQLYCAGSDIAGSGEEYFKRAVLECGGDLETIKDIDTLLAILQSQNT
jgi:hypothetical protein